MNCLNTRAIMKPVACNISRSSLGEYPYIRNLDASLIMKLSPPAISPFGVLKQSIPPVLRILFASARYSDGFWTCSVTLEETTASNTSQRSPYYRVCDI